MKDKLTNEDYIFDGFCERRFDESTDGWLNEMPDERDYPAVRHANDVLAMFDEIKALRTAKWKLEQRLKLWEPIIKGACRAPILPKIGGGC